MTPADVVPWRQRRRRPRMELVAIRRDHEPKARVRPPRED